MSVLRLRRVRPDRPVRLVVRVLWSRGRARPALALSHAPLCRESPVAEGGGVDAEGEHAPRDLEMATVVTPLEPDGYLRVDDLLLPWTWPDARHAPPALGERIPVPAELAAITSGADCAISRYTTSTRSP